MPLDAEAARAIIAALGLTGATVTPLGQGFASDAWLVRHDGTGHGRHRRRLRPGRG